MEKTCLHRLFGDCKNCKVDYEPLTSYHPVNNTSCKNYHEINMISLEINQSGARLENKIKNIIFRVKEVISA
jgi:hypothetical protein